MLPSSCGVWDGKERSKNLCLKLSSNIILIKMRTPTVAVPSGNSSFFLQHVFVVVFCYVALGVKHLASLQPSAWLPPVETPSDRSLSERRSWRPPWCFTLISCQVSHSVGECHSDSGSFWVYTKQRGRLESTAVAASARAWPRSGATPRRGVRKLHLSLAAQLAADGTLFPRVH